MLVDLIFKRAAAAAVSMSVERGLKRKRLVDWWGRLREEGVKRAKLLASNEMRNEAMKQIVEQELGQFVTVHDVDATGIVIVWKGLMLDPAGSGLTLAWDTLCANDPSKSTIDYANWLSSVHKGMKCTTDQHGRLRLELTKTPETAAEWRAEFWPCVKDMIVLVFRYSMLRAYVATEYGADYVRVSCPMFCPFRRNEMMAMTMKIGASRQEPRIILNFYEEHGVPALTIRPSASLLQSPGEMIREISALRPTDEGRWKIFIAAQASGDKQWHVRLRFQCPADMVVILQTVQILKRHGAF
jgi:hypothetical protein